ncbi:Uncharacterized protein Adt_24219 [Abeliophyllum distichum]|uniref:Movement protein n=1 Tax=Abeliophyllum distichum TaxID=126358 RepID=A0ABD1SG90_9LAMI
MSSENSIFQDNQSLSSFRKSNTSKIDGLYEITHIPEAEKSPIKEYVQSSKFYQHFLPATEQEQFVTLELPSHLPRIWLSKGYTHLHFGAVRFALTAHGRKGLPTVARLALLDTRYADYQHACIGTVETTLNAGTILVTMFPNFNMSISDPQLLTALKFQIQIVGAVPTGITYGATLHYQMVYRIPNHALDFVTPQSTEDALFLQMETDHPSCIYVPRQIPRNELLKLIPDTWLTSYEQHHQNSKNAQPIQSTTHHF